LNQFVQAGQAEESLRVRQSRMSVVERDTTYGKGFVQVLTKENPLGLNNSILD
jgi:hypothetical protein